MTHFDHLRATPWNPTFTWIATAHEAADRINRPHEDYPLRVPQTEAALAHLQAQTSIPNALVLEVHRAIFGDQHFAGEWRKVHVIVGPHRPPRVEDIPEMIEDLESCYDGKIRGVGDLVE